MRKNFLFAQHTLYGIQHILMLYSTLTFLSITRSGPS